MFGRILYCRICRVPAGLLENDVGVIPTCGLVSFESMVEGLVTMLAITASFFSQLVRVRGACSQAVSLVGILCI